MNTKGGNGGGKTSLIIAGRPCRRRAAAVTEGECQGQAETKGKERKRRSWGRHSFIVSFILNAVRPLEGVRTDAHGGCSAARPAKQQ